MGKEVTTAHHVKFNQNPLKPNKTHFIIPKYHTKEYDNNRQKSPKPKKKVRKSNVIIIK
jgi:hypothetical protein